MKNSVFNKNFLILKKIYLINVNYYNISKIYY